jgi:hypothetical protein
MIDPTPTADALEAWLVEVERAALEMQPAAPTNLDPPAWVMEGWPGDD